MSLPSQTMTDGATLAERRARLQPWVRFADQASIVAGVYEGTRLCMACNRVIGEGELDFLVVLAGAVALRVDRQCLDLWQEAVKEELAATTQLTLPAMLPVFPPDLRPMVGTCAEL